MGSDIPLGKIFGIKVGMNVTVFLTAGLFAFLLSTNRFPNKLAGMSTTAYWIAGCGASLLFLVSLMIHEIGHALVARDEGIGVHSMALTVLGGVTRMESSPTTPGAEFRVSVVGPIASAVCGVVFFVGAFLLPDQGAWGLLGLVYAWLGLVNIALALLNSLPAAPLDGGKVLTSAIWRVTGDQSLAITWASVAGIVTGMAMLTWGFREIRGVGGREDLAVSAMITGAFIGFSAYQQLRSAPLFRALDGLTVSQVMAASPPTAASWTTIREFLQTADPQPEHQAYPVVGRDGQVSGLLTAAAIRAVPPPRWGTLSVHELAYPLERITIIRSDEPLLSALQKVENADVRNSLVVAADGQVVGTLDPNAMHRGLGMTKAERAATGV